MRVWSGHLVRPLVATGLAVSVLVMTSFMPRPALAHWGVCYDDPKVWLDNGAKVEIGTQVQTDPSTVTHATFTIQVPPGTSLTRIVYTAGKDASFETVNIVSGSSGGYVVDAVVTTAGKQSAPMNLTLHVVNRASTGSSASGYTNQHVLASVSP